MADFEDGFPLFTNTFCCVMFFCIDIITKKSLNSLKKYIFVLKVLEKNHNLIILKIISNVEFIFVINNNLKNQNIINTIC